MIDATTAPLSSVAVQPPPTERWSTSGGGPLPMKLAVAWSRYAPIARGYMPRLIGRRLGRGMRTTVRTRSGGLVAVDPQNLDIYVTMTLNGGLWERHIHEACYAVARPGDTIYDIGANAGIIGIDLASHLKGRVRMFAFEPIPSLARGVALSAAISGLSDRISVYEAMLGAAEGEASLFIPSHAIHASARSRESDAVELKRRVFRIDSLVETGQLPLPDLIKIDVEGAELEVFKGATETLRRARPAIIFEADENMSRFGYTRAELLRLLSDCVPYRYYYITPDGFKPVAGSDETYDDDHNNLLALPPDRPEPRFGTSPAAASG